LFATVLSVDAQSAKVIAIKAGRLVDPVSGKVLTGQTVILEGDRIRQVGPGLKIPDGAEVIDLSKHTVLPGFVDAHVHMTTEPGGNYYSNIFRDSFVDQAVVAHIYAKRTLEAGFTSVRNLGASGFADIALKRAIERGDIPGPRMQVAAFNFGATGNSASSANHGDLTGFSPWLGSVLPPEISHVADGPEGVRKKVRYLIKYGAEIIKFRASAGVLSEEASVGAPKFSQEEMNAIVAEAKLHGIKVAAHAHGTEAIKMAIRAGVDSVEHASFIDEEGIKMAIERGTWLSMDVYNDDYLVAELGALGYPQRIIDKEKLVGLTQRQNFKKAVLAGARIAYGTDAGIYPHGGNGKQFSKMVEWGMTPMQAIQAATVGSAELLGWSETVGRIAPGAFADIVAVGGDPLEDISILEKVSFVMKGGTVIKDARK
jgi:imidazolonepropionase-like amidohydrolase